MRQFRGRTISFRVLHAGSELTRPVERNPAEVKSKTILPGNEAQLNFVSLRSSLHDVGLGGLSKVEMNAQKRAPLTAHPTKGISVSNFSLDMADDFIDGLSEGA
jgi:hypothetical protein